MFNLCRYIIYFSLFLISIVNGQKLNGIAGATNTTTTNSVAMKNNSTPAASATTNTNRQKIVNNRDCHYSGYPKPAYSNACLIALGKIATTRNFISLRYNILNYDLEDLNNV